MIKPTIAAAVLSPLLLAVQCGGSAQSSPPAAESVTAQAEGKSKPQVLEARPFAVTAFGRYNLPWAAKFAPGTTTLFITEKPGTMRFFDTVTQQQGTVTGAPAVDFGVQGGLGDIAFLPSEASATVGERTIYLSWAEAGTGDTRGAAAGRGSLICDQPDTCRIEGLTVIWRQFPKVNGRGHYSHRFAVSPDENYLFITSGERQNAEQAQNLENNLGKVVRLNLDGSIPPDNPLVGQAGKSHDIWSWGHRNMLGLKFDARGRLWDVEHGPDGGDELNLVSKGKNYGWPIVSEGDHYDGTPIPRHSTRPGFRAPAIAWNPVIAPGDFIFYSGNLFSAWRGQAIITGMKPGNLVRVAIANNVGTEIARHRFDSRIREIVEGPDGAIWLLEDGPGGRLLKLTPR